MAAATAESFEDGSGVVCSELKIGEIQGGGGGSVDLEKLESP